MNMFLFLKVLQQTWELMKRPQMSTSVWFPVRLLGDLFTTVLDKRGSASSRQLRASTLVLALIAPWKGVVWKGLAELLAVPLGQEDCRELQSVLGFGVPLALMHLHATDACHCLSLLSPIPFRIPAGVAAMGHHPQPLILGQQEMPSSLVPKARVISQK